MGGAVSRDCIKSGAGFKAIVNEDALTTVDDAYRGLAACAVFQACKDYKAWVVDKYFTAKQLPMVFEQYRIITLLMHIARSPMTINNRKRRAEREKVCWERIRRLLAAKDIPDYADYVQQILEAEEYWQVRQFAKSCQRSVTKRLNHMKAVIKGTAAKYKGLKDFFESETFAIYANGVDGKMIRAEMDRKAREKIWRKEHGLTTAEDDEEDAEPS